jgi:hypothetical protein
MKCEVEIDVEIPDGYKIKRIGLPRMGETFVEAVSPVSLQTAAINFHARICVIVEKDLKWRRATKREVCDFMFDSTTSNLHKGVEPIRNIKTIDVESAFCVLFDGQSGWYALSELYVSEQE